MRCLTVIHDVDDFVGRPGFETIVNGRQIGRHVVEATVILTNDRRGRHPLAVAVDEERIVLRRQRAVREDAHRAVAFPGNAPGAEVVHDALQLRIVETFAQRVIELNPEPGVERVELLL